MQELDLVLAQGQLPAVSQEADRHQAVADELLRRPSSRLLPSCVLGGSWQTDLEPQRHAGTDRSGARACGTSEAHARVESTGHKGGESHFG